MPVDDTDDKVRRNLVVFSALIVASAWLGHPELWLVTKLLTPEAAPPPAWKVSSLALAILIYLFARYWFSAAHSTARTTMSNDWYQFKTDIRTKLLTQKIQNYHITKKQPSFITTDLDDYLYGQLRSKGVAPKEEFQIRFEAVRIQQRGEWDGELFTTRSFNASEISGMSSGGNSLGYQFPARMQRKIKFQAAVRQLFYSRTAFDFFTPIILSAVAMMVLLVRLCNSLLSN